MTTSDRSSTVRHGPKLYDSHYPLRGPFYMTGLYHDQIIPFICIYLLLKPLKYHTYCKEVNVTKIIFGSSQNTMSPDQLFERKMRKHRVIFVRSGIDSHEQVPLQGSGPVR